MKHRFSIDRFGLHPSSTAEAKRLLFDMGVSDNWAKESYISKGEVFCDKVNSTYDIDSGVLYEDYYIELIKFLDGPNFMDMRSNADPHRAAYVGKFCNREEVDYWRKFFRERNINIIQEMISEFETDSGDSFRCKEIIFDTYSILGLDTKIVVPCAS